MADRTEPGEAGGRGDLALSALVVCEGYGQIAELVRSLASQSRPGAIELVCVLPRGAELGSGPELGSLGAVASVHVDDVHDLRDARAAGLARASAPLVLLAETHCWPTPRWLDAVLGASARGWGLIGPRFDNANPGSALSWGSFLDHYGRFHADPRRRRLHQVAGHNSVISRDAALALGSDLAGLLRDFPELHRRLRESGAQPGYEPAAVMRHLNITRPSAWLAEGWAGGRVSAASRARDWPRGRRLAYALGWPAIAAVELRRRRRFLRRARHAEQLPRASGLALAGSVAVRCAGEAAGFALGASARAERRLAETELDRLRYVSEAEAAAIAAG